jgi:molybdopterin molybdotransferase
MPRAPDAARLKPFFRVVSTDEARAAIRRLGAVGTETVAAGAAAGRVLATDLAAPIDLPHFHRANMDGYAVRAADTFGASTSVPAYLKIAGTIEMGREATRALRKGQAMRIATGGMLPRGADAVVMVEHTDEVGDGTLEVHRGVSPWQHVLRIGEDIAKGASVFRAGRRLRAHDLGALTGLGITRISVYRTPRLGLIATGDEIVPPEKQPRPGQVRNVNQFSLAAMAAAAGAAVTDYGVVPDRRDRLQKSLATALARHDVVMLSGGSSVGVKDLTTDVITSFPKSEIVFHGISVAPGKPTILARALDKPVLGLPGHPVSALVIFDLFAAPLLRVVGGEDPSGVFAPRSTLRARLSQNVASQAGREDYIRVRLVEVNGCMTAQPLPGKSGAIFNLVSADGLVCIPASVEGLDDGAEVDVIRFS